MKVKQEVWNMGGIAEVDDVDAARYIGKYLHRQ